MYDGLTKQEVEYRINNNLVNNENIKYTRSTKTIILTNIFTLFNFINIGLLVLVLTTGSLQNGLFAFIIIINTIIAIIQEIKAKVILDNLKISTQEKVKVKRDGEIQEILKTEIVIDDVLVLSSGDQVVVDSIILKSSNLEVDESIITGESDPILKKKDDNLLSGAIIVSGNCLAKVVSIGKDNYEHKLIKEASNIEEEDSYLMKSVNKILKIVTFLIIPVGILLFTSQYFYSGQSYKEAILSTVAGIIGMIPEGLVLLTSLALTVGVIKMARRKVIIQKLSGIEMLSCVDVLCLDKTGTITDGSMEVIDTVNLTNDNIEEIMFNMIPDKLVNATDIAISKKFTKGNIYNVKKAIPFSSYRKYSAKVFDQNTYILGALEYITKENISKYDKYLSKYIEKGYRIISLCKSKKDMDKDIPSDIKVIAFIIIKDNVRLNAKETLKYFKEQEVDIKIISGDNPKTVSNIMKGLDFDNYDKYIEGSNLPTDYKELVSVINNYTIFGRCTPKQKQLIIKALKEKSTVGMIGDGVNDILALKESDCGIALATGISAARSVSEVVLTTEDFSVLPKIVDEGRRVVNNIERVASMFLVKTTYSFILSILVVILSHEYPFYPIQLSLIGSICVGVPSFFLALEPNYNKVTGNFMVKVFRNALPSGICVFINIFFLIMITSLFNISYNDVRIIVVSLTGFINLRLLYNICKPLNLQRQILLVGCTITFFELLILLPSLFLVNKYSIINVIIIIIMSVANTYIISFLEDIYDKLFKRSKYAKQV